jgi:alpha-N-arabinofuranosidase
MSLTLRKKMKKIIITVYCFSCLVLYGQKKADIKVARQATRVEISASAVPVSIDPMIYGQMLEDCNDRIIYGGVTGSTGQLNPAVTELLKSLDMPVVRWPGGTYVDEYDWEKGTGDLSKRPVVHARQWRQVETNQFGTDEFLKWCREVGSEPYINFNMGWRMPLESGSLGDAINWIEYVNGSTSTVFGRKRALYGHPEPYNVRYWGVGNENYYYESAMHYGARLHRWATAIKSMYPEISLIGVGYKYHWNDSILRQNGHLIDFLTIHFYMQARVKDNALEDCLSTTFAPARIELDLKKNIELLDRINAELGRSDNPIRYSIDEWNCRHSVFDGKKFAFTRHDDRRQFDIPAVAGMLNVMIRQSPAVGMANYIFPVNGHGLVRTTGDSTAYRTPIYHVFELYRKYMTGKRFDISIEGTTVTVPVKNLTMEGATDREFESLDLTLTNIDGAAMQPEEGVIYIALINRSPYESQKIHLQLPSSYVPQTVWNLEHPDINAANTPDQTLIAPKVSELSAKAAKKAITLTPCGFALIKCEKQ